MKTWHERLRMLKVHQRISNESEDTDRPRVSEWREWRVWISTYIWFFYVFINLNIITYFVPHGWAKTLIISSLLSLHFSLTQIDTGGYHNIWETKDGVIIRVEEMSFLPYSHIFIQQAICSCYFIFSSFNQCISIVMSRGGHMIFCHVLRFTCCCTTFSTS